MQNTESLQFPDEISERQPIVLFDGECNLCNGSVWFLIRNNHKGNLSFASLQSDIAIKILEMAGKSYPNKDTLLLVQDDVIYDYSTAALKITAHLRFPWNLPAIFIGVPSTVRDAIYRYISRNRYHWFGNKSECFISDRDIAQRFL